jgi:small-conductance mechanosensitive channel
MRGLFTLLLMMFALALAMPDQAHAQAAATHPAPAAAKASPAPPAPSTIIPGSPLAALTGAAAPATPATGNNPASPFGTAALGLSVTKILDHDAAEPVNDFITAIRKSTTLTPVWSWLGSFGNNPARQQALLGIVEGLAITLLPAAVLDVLIRLLLTRPRAMLARRARTPSSVLAAEPFEQVPAAEPLEEVLAAEPPEQITPAAEPPEQITSAEPLEQTTPAPAAQITPAKLSGRILVAKRSAVATETETRPRRLEIVLAWSHRLMLAVLVLLLNLLPIVGFGLAAGLLLNSGLITARDTRLSIVGAGNAYLVCRISLEILRFITAPWTPPLRLFAMRDANALWLNKWMRIVLATGGFSFAIISISEILGLPPNGAKAVTRLLVLALHIELAAMIWLGRKVVAKWIRGKPDANSHFSTWRRRLASIWHYPALFYILALWVAWAGGVPHAFGVLLRVVLYFMAALFLGRLGWSGSDRGLERIFPDPKGRELRHPNLVGRARAYNPLIRTLIRIIIGIAVLAVILMGWGIRLLPWLLRNPISRSLLFALIWVVVIIAIALVIWEIANNWLDGRIEQLSDAGKTRQALRLRTLAPILKATIGTVIGLLAGLFSLNRIGVNAAPLLAGAGVLGIAIGFGSQKLVQDIITGLFLLLEDTMQVGDVVTLAGMSGTVERLSIRTIRLRGGDGSVNIIPFSAVTTVTNQTRDFGTAQISVGISYEENVDHACAVLMDIARQMRAEPTWGSMMRDDLQINGLDQLGASALMITGQIRTGPGQHWAVRREFNRRMVQRFAVEHIEIPYTYRAPAPPPVPAAPTVPPSQEPSQDQVAQGPAHKIAQQPQDAAANASGAAVKS